jgi:DNA-binding transcriptional LysR family regulator
MDLTCGTVSVGVSEVALHNLLLPILRNYQKSYPGVHLHIANHATSQAVEALQNGLVDLAVVTTPLSVPKDMKKTTICSFREVAICGSDYTFLCGRKLSARDLASYPLISLDAQSRTFEFYSGLFQKHGVPFHPSLEVATADQVIPMVRHNLGIGFIPESFLEDYKDREEQPDFHTLELKFHIPERDICLVRHAGFNLNSAARRLEEMIVP